jgi:hypothetical protein
MGGKGRARRGNVRANSSPKGETAPDGQLFRPTPVMPDFASGSAFPSFYLSFQDHSGVCILYRREKMTRRPISAFLTENFPAKSRSIDGSPATFSVPYCCSQTGLSDFPVAQVRHKLQL